MAKKKEIEHDDVFFEDGGGSLAMYDGYEPIKVDTELNRLNGKAKKYISDLIEFYTTIKPSSKDADIETLAIYDSTIADSKALMKANYDMEAVMLANMLLSLRTSQHILHTLLTQFNNGGYMDDKATERLMQFTKSNISITKDVTNYKRSIRNEIKDLRTDITQFSSVSSRDEIGSIVNSNEEAVTDGKKEAESSNIQRGTKDINELINKAVRERKASTNRNDGFEEAKVVV